MQRRALFASAIATAVLWCGFASPVTSGEPLGAPTTDAAALDAIARDVKNRASTGAGPSAPEPSTRTGDIEAPSLIAGAPDVSPGLSNIPPAQAGISVITRPSVSPPKQVPAATSGYQSNSWRQALPETGRPLSFSSGVAAPASGVDPALKAQADRLRAQGQPFVYGFLLLRVPPEGAIQKTLAQLGVTLLGPHVHHQKARLPVGSLDAVAALPEVESITVSPPAQKLSSELGALRAAQVGPSAAASAALPIVINLFEADTSGAFRQQLEAQGAVVGEYDPALYFYRAVATWPVIDRIAALDFVLFLELIRPTSPGHDQSTPLIDVDWIRPGGSFPTRYSGASSTLGILDSGFMLGTAAAVMHDDLNKNGCGLNFTTDAAGVWNDQNGHGTHVLTTISGTGTANSRYRGVATGAGSTNRIRAGKIWKSDNTGQQSWMESGMDFMSNASECDSPAPLVINISGGASGTGQTGTDSTSRKLDDKVWTNRQAYVVCSGNSGPGSQTIWSPGVAKNALTVGNVLDNGYLTVGDINNGSSRGPTGDGRMKPNLVGPGTTVTSALAGTTSSYTNKVGCSMATPHVTGLAATLMEHYPEFQNNPALLRAHMMASAIAHDDVTGKSNDYGTGRVSGYLEHWAQFDSAGWQTNWFWGSVSSTNWQYGDITVPVGAQRLVVVLTWDEPAASAGASRAVTYDVDLWIDRNADCNEPIHGACGEYASFSSIDNVEYVVVDNPPPGLYRLKASNFNAPSFALPYGLAAMIIRGDPTPPMSAFLSAPASTVVGSTFAVTATVSNPAYVASGVQIAMTSIPSGVTLLDLQTTRADGVTMSFFGTSDALTLGNVVSGLSRSATWWFRADTTGPKTFSARAWSENAGAVTPSTTTQVNPLQPDLVESSASMSPASPVVAPGNSFSVTDVARNAGAAASGTSTTRYYLSLDGVKNAGDTLLSGTRTVPGLAVAATSSGTVTVTVPSTTAVNTYFLLACADDLGAVAENNEGNNCVVASGAVTVTRPDLVENSVTASPAAPTGGPGMSFSVTDTARNTGAVGAGPSTTRYYLSLDAVRNAGDVLLNGSRPVGALAAGTASSGTVTVTIPASTPSAAYFLLACADDLNIVPETNEANNCVAASTSPTVTVTLADLTETSVTMNPPAPVRAPGTTFSATDTAKNAGSAAAGSSTTRYYLSLDGVKDASDTLLTGSRAVPGLLAGASQSGTATVTIPATTPLNTYFVLACADDLHVVTEASETNNCVASAATVTVARPDLVEDAVSAPPPSKARGTAFAVTDTARNAGGLASNASTTRYYLSLGTVKSASDLLLTGSRAVPALAAGATSSGAVTVTIPAGTPLNTYFLLACADSLAAVAESNESNNCRASSTTVTVTP